jgi:hypothetical protein
MLTSSGPLLWGRCNFEKTSKTSRYGDALLYSFINFSVPANVTNFDVVKTIAEKSGIPIESLCEDMNQPEFFRGRVFYGYVGNVLDQIAEDYIGMQWWVSDGGLNMVTVKPENPARRPPILAELLEARPAKEQQTKRRRIRKTNPKVMRIRARVLELRREGLDYRAICKRLGSFDRPPQTSWKDLPWPRAYMNHTTAVTKWLSDACRSLRS